MRPTGDQWGGAPDFAESPSPSTTPPTTDATARDELAGLHERIEQLEGALESRVLIEQAKGILMARRHVGAEQAFHLLREASRSNGEPLRVVAQRVVDNHREPDPLDDAW